MLKNDSLVLMTGSDHDEMKSLLRKLIDSIQAESLFHIGKMADFRLLSTDEFF